MARLQDISNELFELVVGQVDFKTMCSLRLVSRAISNMTNQTTFQSHFRSARLSLTPGDLKNFEKATAGLLGYCIEELTLIGVIYDLSSLEQLTQSHHRVVPSHWNGSAWVPYTEKELAQAKQELTQLQKQHVGWMSIQRDGAAVALLGQAFNHIHDKSKHCCLKKLSLEVQVVRGTYQTPSPPRYPLSDFRFIEDEDEDEIEATGEHVERFRKAGEIFSLAMSSLQQSKLQRVDALDIYGSKHSSVSYGLPVDALSDALISTVQMDRALLSSVGSLSISFAGFLSQKKRHDWSRIKPELGQGNPYTSLVELLLSCPNVEDLHIDHCKITRYSTLTDVGIICKQPVINRQIGHVISPLKLPRLRKLHIGKMELKAEDLAEILLGLSSSLQSLELDKTRVKGILSKALAPISDGTCRYMDSLRITYVSENGMHVLEGLDQDQWNAGLNFIRRHGEDVRIPLIYRTLPRAPAYPSGLHPHVVCCSGLGLGRY